MIIRQEEEELLKKYKAFSRNADKYFEFKIGDEVYIYIWTIVDSVLNHHYAFKTKIKQRRIAQEEGYGLATTSEFDKGVARLGLEIEYMVMVPEFNRETQRVAVNGYKWMKADAIDRIKSGRYLEFTAEEIQDIESLHPANQL